MRHSFFAAVIGVCCLLSISLSGQQTASSPALLYLQRSYSQLVASNSITDVTLTGSVRRIAGSDDETGTVVFRALSVGASRMDLGLTSGPRTEIHSLAVNPPVGRWSGPDGAPHSISFHNLIAEPNWIAPAFPVHAALSGSTDLCIKNAIA
jgi:hypothetical protein